MSLTKQQLDRYFTVHYEEIKLYIEKSFSKHKIWNEEPDFFLSELYVYVEKRLEEIDSEATLKKYISTFIHNNTYWTNSSVREAEIYGRRIRQVEYVQSHHEDLIDSPEGLEQDELINEYKAVVEMYYASLTSLEKKSVWEIYFIEKKQTVSAFAEHIQMSRTVADKFIKELKNDIRTYYKKYKETQQ